MWVNVAEVTHKGGHVLHVKFEDGAEGDIDLSKHLKFRNIFAPLRDPDYVAKVRVDRESGTICWPNDADFDSVVLYHYVTGKPMPDWAGPIVRGDW